MKLDTKLTILTSVFTGGLIAANMLGSKLTTLFGVAVSVGIFALPLTFLITDAVGEVLGRKKSMSIVYSAFIAQVLVLLLMVVAIKMPPASRYQINNEFVTVFQTSIRMTVASLIAYLVSQLHDVWAFDMWKKKLNGKYLWLRNNASTFVSQAIDTLLFMFIAFYGISDKFTVSFILQLSVTYWLFKIAFAAMDTPFVYLLVLWLRKSTKQEIALEKKLNKEAR
ncbi:queuosine precursor transporter [Patescibacteria group bacterium]|nr:queuosine precursor transporter [Patescibacteria group bacterium]MBU1721382.1 queuosine precursor transporter [Patescibacteria group bacterium]MBU1900910.1 queuosine precursor transporter [Patescibacteria group bacterium]